MNCKILEKIKIEKLDVTIYIGPQNYKYGNVKEVNFSLNFIIFRRKGFLCETFEEIEDFIICCDKISHICLGGFSIYKPDFSEEELKLKYDKRLKEADDILDRFKNS